MIRKILFGLFCIASPVWANAYIGPGPASTFISASIGWLCAIGFSLFVILSWPLRIMYRKIQSKVKKKVTTTKNRSNIS